MAVAVLLTLGLLAACSGNEAADESDVLKSATPTDITVASVPTTVAADPDSEWGIELGGAEMTVDGYDFTITYLAEITGARADVLNAAPGSADLAFDRLALNVKVANEMPERNLPAMTFTNYLGVSDPGFVDCVDLYSLCMIPGWFVKQDFNVNADLTPVVPPQGTEYVATAYMAEPVVAHREMTEGNADHMVTLLDQKQPTVVSMWSLDVNNSITARSCWGNIIVSVRGETGRICESEE